MKILLNIVICQQSVEENTVGKKLQLQEERKAKELTQCIKLEKNVEVRAMRYRKS